jgi:trehalose/maltose hydrolase-like predicted phosphorylase
MFGFSGLSFVEDGVQLDPHLPPKWDRLAFRFQWRQCRIRVEIERSVGSILVSLDEGDSVRVSVKGETPRLVQRSGPLRLAWNADPQPPSQLDTSC